MFLFATLAEATQYVNFTELMGENSEVAFSVFGLPIRWYALAYLAGIFLGYWYLLKLIAQPGAPMARRHADDMIFWAMLGIILGGRLGYVLFYNLEAYAKSPVSIFRLWDGGMSLHGGVIGVLVAIWYVTRKEKLSFLRFCDYIACTIPFGLFLGRIANFVNGELWGRVTDVPWAIVFPYPAGDLPRHPSQLYEAGLEG
ncbi:MAG: prolipoprotein diacylglyceryl transferase, partial [Sphingopyxis sp.]|nr:prolipoprotein diacylglyceryl transferase [Sphingopyxis sp.]